MGTGLGPRRTRKSASTPEKEKDGELQKRVTRRVGGPFLCGQSTQCTRWIVSLCLGGFLRFAPSSLVGSSVTYQTCGNFIANSRFLSFSTFSISCVWYESNAIMEFNLSFVLRFLPRLHWCAKFESLKADVDPARWPESFGGYFWGSPFVRGGWVYRFCLYLQILESLGGRRKASS